MDFYEAVQQAAKLLQAQGKVTYRTLARQFALDEEALKDLKEELIFSHPVADKDGKGLVWTVSTEETPVTDQPQSVAKQAQSTQDTLTSVAPFSPDAERRQLTVMFVDLVGSTRLSGQLDPEDLRDVIHAYQSACAEVIQHYDGYVAQHLGDGLLVYFGYPQAHEDDPQRALHSGLSIIKSLKDLNANARLEMDKNIELSIRVGIHTGLVVIGEIGSSGRQEQLALGETPNIAARIEGIAEPNTVVISAETHRLTEGYFDCQALGEYHLKGVTHPMAAYRVLQESETQHRLDLTVSGGLTPLVGRESEIALLLDRWEQAKSGQGQVVLLSGEAGIGKSRLTRTLGDHIETASHHRLECRCSPYFQNTTLYPLIDLLERTMEFDRQDTPETKLRKLEATLSEFRVDIKTTLPLLAFPLSIPLLEDQYPPLELTPQRRKQKVLETFIAMMLEMAEREPVLLILEDLHWVDASTIELLDLLLEQTPTASILVVLTCRPEFQPPWGLKSSLTPIALNRLPRQQIETLIERVTDAKRLPEEVIQHLVEKTDGVPLYVEEMTKALLESGHLKADDTGYALTEPLATLSIPATLQDSLMARLDRLDTAKGVAQLGAVIGRQFSYDLLRAISPLNETRLQSELERLVDAELIYQRGVSPNPTYLFKHALIQDTAYGSLLRSTRQNYHRRIAEALTGQFPETVNNQPELLAYHYTESGFAKQAVGYWQQAGEKAVERSANAEAVAHLGQGLDLLRIQPEAPERNQRELHMQLALGLAFTQHKGVGSSEVEAVYLRARELCHLVQDAPQMLTVLNRLSQIYNVRGPLQTAQELSEQVLSLAAHQDDTYALINAHAGLAGTINRLGNFTRAREHVKRAKQLSQFQKYQSQIIDWAMGLRHLWTESRLLWKLGYPDQGLMKSNEALTLAQERSHPFVLVNSYCYGALVHQFRGEWDTTRELAECAVTLASEHGFAQWMAIAAFWRGWAWLALGQVEEGIAETRKGLTGIETAGSHVVRSNFLTYLAHACHKSQQTKDGLQAVSEAQSLAQTTGERNFEAERYRLTGDLLLQRSCTNAAEAESCFQQAISIAQSQSAKSWELRAATSLARLWQSQGKRDEAHDLLAPVYHWFTEGFDTTDLIDAKVLLNELP